jgi:hypothetical protein
VERSVAVLWMRSLLVEPVRLQFCAESSEGRASMPSTHAATRSDVRPMAVTYDEGPKDEAR